MLEACLKRREEQLEAWRALGPPQVGRSEKDFKRRPGDIEKPMDTEKPRNDIHE
jgi:hypothetical protein